MSNDKESVRITHNAVNFSKANRQPSFGIGKRFPSVKKPYTDSIGYDIPSTIEKKTCTFGHGNRFATPEIIRERKEKSSKYFEVKLIESPPPGSYRLISDFDVGNERKSKITKSGVYSFGIGR